MTELKPGMVIQCRDDIRVKLVAPVDMWVIEKYELADGKWENEGKGFMDIGPKDVESNRWKVAEE